MLRTSNIIELTEADKKEEARPKTVRGKRSAVPDDVLFSRDEKLESGVVESSAQRSTSAGDLDSKKSKIDLDKSAEKESKELQSLKEEETEDSMPKLRKVEKQSDITAESEDQKNMESPAQTSSGNVDGQKLKNEVVGAPDPYSIKTAIDHLLEEMSSSYESLVMSVQAFDPCGAKHGKRTPYAAESKVQKDTRRYFGSIVLAFSTGSEKLLGLHFSAEISLDDACSLEQAIYKANAGGCRSFALSFSIPRHSATKYVELTTLLRWNDAIQETEFDLNKIIVHGKCLMKLGYLDAGKLAETRKDMLDECILAERLGIKMYNFHPGATTEICSGTINYIIENTSFIILVIETMAGQGNTVGGKFEEIKAIIDQVEKQWRHRVGVSINMCHIFAAGYDIRTEEAYAATMKTFDDVIGNTYLKAFYINDSYGDLGCKTDRLQYIGSGKMGMGVFRYIMNDRTLNGIPMILESPKGDYNHEMCTLYKQEDKDRNASQ